jgi:hypothetical protein
MPSKHNEAATITALQQLDTERKAAEVALEAGVSTHTIYAGGRSTAAWM